MGRSPCCEKAHTNKGAWTKDEDQRLIDYIRVHGEGCWRSLPKAAGLLRCGKSCRLRWINYLRPDLKRGNFTEEEDELIIKLHSLLGNKWSLIAGRLPGRTDNEIKNYWNTHIKRKLINRGIDPQTHRPLNDNRSTVTVTTKPAQLDFKTSSVQAISEDINLLKYKDLPTLQTETSVEENNCSSSGMTTDEQQQQQRDCYEEQEVNLELTIGLGRTRTGSTRSASANSAESRLQQVSYSLFGIGIGNGNRRAGSACLCWQLGFQKSEMCNNCESSNGLRRYC
ncbi:hypothetical protein K2173_015095 [Erythroxylum novogranatense]|uniref:Uncharacterized protein n=1 Tax=Erythroxylum novogranatense TaxID=1862640 RepID=A0AAV8T2D9_9ROSI|nr:hypothetical protein K2173_015095 [Erythroxylum novogranatense]